VPLNQTITKAGQNRVIETRIAQFKTQKVLPVNPSAHGFSGIPVGKTFGELHDRYERQPPRHHSRLSSYREKGCEKRIVKYRAKVITKIYVSVSGGDGGFTLPNLPPGKYTLTAWHEAYGDQTQDVTISGNETKTINFVFKAKPY